MILIAHRGLLDGPDKDLENRPDQIELALSRGFDVEVDVRYTRAGWMLGHDYEQYSVSESFLARPGLWLHCKNSIALERMTPEMHYFWHQEDDYTLTSRGIVWAFPGRILPHCSTVCVLPELICGPDNVHSISAYAVCTDYLNRYTTRDQDGVSTWCRS